MQIINLQAIPGEGMLVRLAEGALSVCSGGSRQCPTSSEAENYTVGLGIGFVWDISRGNTFQRAQLERWLLALPSL